MFNWESFMLGFWVVSFFMHLGARSLGWAVISLLFGAWDAYKIWLAPSSEEEAE